jgi:hypothetical protein
MAEVQFPAGARDFFLLHSVYIGFGAQPVSYTMGTNGSFPEIEQPRHEVHY